MKQDYLFYLKEVKQKKWSFKYFEQLVDRDKIDRETLNDIGGVLMQYKGSNERRLLFGSNFFDTYGKRIAGNCGCTQLLYDHQRLKVDNFQPVVNFYARMIRDENFQHNYTRTATALVSTFQVDLSVEYVRRLLSKEMGD